MSMSPSNSGITAAQIDSNQLAVDRTRLAQERTLLAWVRTATGLITFGFSLYKFLQFQPETNGAVVHDRLIGPREFAIGAMALGLVALFLATWEHTVRTRALRAQDPGIPRSLAGLFGGLISVFGLVGLVE